MDANGLTMLAGYLIFLPFVRCMLDSMKEWTMLAGQLLHNYDNTKFILLKYFHAR